MEVYQLLPMTNCKKCGDATCMAFAVKLINGEEELEKCTPLFEEGKYKDKLEKLQAMFATVEGATETGLLIDTDKCTGCGNCVVACPVNVANDPHGAAIGNGPTNEKVILKVEDGVVVAVNVHECRRFGKNRIMCDLCIVTCPSGAIEFV